jgi:single-strand DNA-binding protein
MPSYNKVVLIGRLTRDPELRYTAGGLAMTRFGLAVDRRFKNQQGERVTDFFDCTAWRQKAEFVANYVGKGRLVCVEGTIELNEAVGQDGQKRRYTNIVCDNVETLDSQRDGAGGEGGGAGYNRGGAMAQGGGPEDSGSAAGGYYPDDDSTAAAPQAAARGAAPRAAAQGGAAAPAAPRAAAPGAAAAPAGAAYADDDFDDADPFADQ